MSTRNPFVALFALGAAALSSGAPAAQAQTQYGNNAFFAMPEGRPGESSEVAFMCLSGYDITTIRGATGEVPRAISIGIDDNIRGGFSILTVPTSLIVNGSDRVDGHSYIQLPVIESPTTGGIFLDITGNGDFDNNVTQGRAAFIEEAYVNEETRRISPTTGARVEAPTLDELYLLADTLGRPMVVQDDRYATRAFWLQPRLACNPPRNPDWFTPRTTSSRDSVRDSLTWRQAQPDTSFYPGYGLPPAGQFITPYDLQRFRDQIVPPRRHRDRDGHRPG